MFLLTDKAYTEKPKQEGLKMPEFYTIQEVAKALKVTVRTIYSWNTAGKITFTRLGAGRLRISRDELDRFIAAGTPQH